MNECHFHIFVGKCTWTFWRQFVSHVCGYQSYFSIFTELGKDGFRYAFYICSNKIPKTLPWHITINFEGMPLLSLKETAPYFIKNKILKYCGVKLKKKRNLRNISYNMVVWLILSSICLWDQILELSMHMESHPWMLIKAGSDLAIAENNWEVGKLGFILKIFIKCQLKEPKVMTSLILYFVTVNIKGFAIKTY